MTTETATQTYAIDPVHTTVEFSVKHLMISTVKGKFREFEGAVHIDDEDPTRSWTDVTISTASVDTGAEMRDDDLRSDNFFDAEHFPTMRFRSTAVERIDDDNWRVHGDLTIRDVTRPVALDTELEGRGPDAWGGERIGFTAKTKIDRRDFGLTYNAALETGGVVVGNDVKINLNVEAILQRPEVGV